jgi:glycine cleavage system H protein
MAESEAYLRYRRARFATRLPTDRRYSKSHVWLRPGDGATWRIGHTRFAMRMLGDPVEIGFEIEAGEELERGQVIGWLEGFKAVTDLYAPMGGRFGGANPELATHIEAMTRRPYDEGWLYEVTGEPEDDLLDAEAYAAFLDGSIDQAMGKDAT